MDIKVKDKVNQRHVGRNLQRIRVYLGMKQEALASDLGVSQQEISKIEKQDEIEDGLLTKIAEVLGISTDVIRILMLKKPFVILITIKMPRFLREQQQLFMQLIRNRLILLKRWLNCMSAC